MLKPTWTAKWKKIQLLVQLGLRDRRELEESIARFAVRDIHAIINYCEARLGEGISIILIAVPHDYQKSLPNFILKNKDDLKRFAEDNYSGLVENYVELWCCPQTNKRKKFFGRLIIDANYPGDPCIMEMMWESSARSIDRYWGKGDYIAVRTSLSGQEMSTIHCSQDEIMPERMHRTASAAKDALVRSYAIPIISFITNLSILQVRTLCLEFDYDDEKDILNIIDFDTEDDLRVIEYFTGSGYDDLWQKKDLAIDK